MNKIEVGILHEGHYNPEGMMMFLAKLTQRGHLIRTLADVQAFYKECMEKDGWKSSKGVAQMNHGTIKRMSPITLVIVGASRRFLAQARTHSIGLTWLSGSLQYSDYSDDHAFNVPYEVLEAELMLRNGDASKCINGMSPLQWYKDTNKRDMEEYKLMVDSGFSNDTAGYKAPQSLRNVLVVNGNHEALDNFIRRRICTRNTPETQYVSSLMLQELYKSTNGDVFFAKAGADCTWGVCREGKMCCGKPLKGIELVKINENPGTAIIQKQFPLLSEMEALLNE